MPDTRTYNVISNDNCLFESMTKEQILAAITQAVESHEIADVDTGFVQTIKEQNHGNGLKFWVGTTAEYNALQTHDDDCFYILTDDVELDDIESELDAFRQNLSDMGESVSALSATILEQESQINNLETVASIYEAESRVKRAIKNNPIFLDITVDYDDIALPLPLNYIEPDPETGEVINAYDFQTLIVKVNGVGEILCDVYNVDASNNCYIRGTGCGGTSSTNGVTLANVNLQINRSNNTLTQNKSTIMIVGSGGTVSLRGATISQIRAGYYAK